MAQYFNLELCLFTFFVVSNFVISQAMYVCVSHVYGYLVVLSIHHF